MADDIQAAPDDIHGKSRDDIQPTADEIGKTRICVLIRAGILAFFIHAEGVMIYRLRLMIYTPRA